LTSLLYALRSFFRSVSLSVLPASICQLFVLTNILLILYNYTIRQHSNYQAMSPLNYIFYTLSDQTRRDILKLLQKRDMTPGEIIEQFLITKPSLTHHLNVLKQANLVTTERKGQKIYYSLNVSVLEETTGLVFDLLAKFNEKRIPSKKEK